MLIYIEGRFLDHVEGRFIKKDRRHHQLIVLKQEDLEVRNFDSWQMGFKSLGLDDYKKHPYFFELGDNCLNNENFKASNTALSLFKSFYDTHKAFDFH